MMFDQPPASSAHGARVRIPPLDPEVAMTRPIRASRGSVALAMRLRRLREDQSVTQRQLATALGVQSVGTISAYENVRNPLTPPLPRLRSYATFFATHRSVADSRTRLLPEEDLDEQERVARDRLLADLLALAEPAPEPAARGRPSALWVFPPDEPVRIVCGHLADMTHPYGDPTNQNYTELFTFADVDALAELYAHLWRVNPESGDVRYLRADRLTRADDLNSHLVLLGGNGINAAVQRLVDLTDLPVRQVTGTGLVEDGDIFAVGDKQDQFLPTFRGELGLVEDVGLFARLRHPYNSARTLTLCSGVFSRGVLGAVRCLTDDKLRDQNASYLSERFANADQFAILMRVQVLKGAAITPDLQNPEVRLWEWSDAEGEAAGAGDRVGER
jgi:transcriptional regulator with XRE-family HTH domain